MNAVHYRYTQSGRQQSIQKQNKKSDPRIRHTTQINMHIIIVGKTRAHFTLDA